MAIKDAPNDLNSDTPDWFKDWRNNEFWHFKQRVEFNNKFIIIIMSSLVAAAIAKLLF